MLSIQHVLSILKCLHEIFKFLFSSLVFKIQCVLCTRLLGRPHFHGPKATHNVASGWQHSSKSSHELFLRFSKTVSSEMCLPSPSHSCCSWPPSPEGTPEVPHLLFPRRPLATLNKALQTTMALKRTVASLWGKQREVVRQSKWVTFPTWLHLGEGQGLQSDSLNNGP